MSKQIRITFDSNVWRPIVSPSTFPNDPDTGHFQIIRQAVQQNLALGYLSETTFTLEAIQKTSRKEFFGGYKMKTESTVEEMKDGSIRMRMVISPDPSRHATNNSYLSKHLKDALALNFKLLKCARIAGVRNPDLQPTDYASDDRFSVSERQERLGKCSRSIETQGWGIKHIKNIGNKFANGGAWMDGIGSAPTTEDGIIAKAVAEWADGDAVAAHYGYGNDYFCTRDNGKAAGASSVLSQPNQAWLSQEYKIQIVSPSELAKTLALPNS